MAAFKCKMCGGNLEITEGVTVCECEYCGTNQTVPNADSEKKLNLFNRANRLRSACEFDKAATIYESIVSEFPEESEAYWGLCLCTFGIEYIDDPKTEKKVPTCHRTSYTSIFDDNNFDMACEYADSVAVQVYRSEAKEIDRLQKEILNIAKSEEPFDIFICYKESNENGQRTVDSELAHDLYDVLTEKGYKVFYSRITLKAKLGQDYEPYIFSALNSAKVMLAVGTKYEYYNAVWVKNEWSRYLALMKTDTRKMLIPCYKDIDAYDIPKEFNHFQAQDLGSPRAFQDLITNIEKIIPKNVGNQSSAGMQQVLNVNTGVEAAIASLLKRAFIFINNKEWDKADNLLEQVLNAEPENAQAYLGKMLIDFKLCDMSDILKMRDPIDENNNYKNAVRFADEKLKSRLVECKNTVRYNDATQKMDSAKSVEEFTEAKNIFQSISGFRDSDALADQCLTSKNVETYVKAVKIMDSARKTDDYQSALKILKSIPGFKGSDVMAKQCQEKIYNDAINIMDSAEANHKVNSARSIAEYDAAKTIFLSIRDFNDSNTKANKCAYNIACIKMNNAGDENECKIAADIFTHLGEFSDAAEMVKKCEVKRCELIYKRACNTMNNAGDENECKIAADIFAHLGEFSDAAEMVKKCEVKRCELIYKRACNAMNSAYDEKDYKHAADIFTSLGKYSNAAEMAEKCEKNAISIGKYITALKLLQKDSVDDIKTAIGILENIKGFKDSVTLLANAKKQTRWLEYSEKIDTIRDKKRSIFIEKTKLGVFDKYRRDKLNEQLNELNRIENSLKLEYKDVI